MNNKCINCNNKARLFTKMNKIVCMDCRKLDEFTLITKTDSKNIYLLTDNDLSDLTSFTATVKNKLATYYTKHDIINKACNKYNTIIDNLKDILKQLHIVKYEEKKIKEDIRKKNKEVIQNKRKERLINGLAKYKLELRNDSMLCKNYIYSGENTVKQIVNRMCQMKYLYDYCHMDECKDEAYEKYSDDCDYNYYKGCVSELAEEIALNKYSNGKYPEVYPWMV